MRHQRPFAQFDVVSETGYLGNPVAVILEAITRGRQLHLI